MKCEHWEKDGRLRGRCLAGVYINPSAGVCSACPANTTKEHAIPVEEARTVAQNRTEKNLSEKFRDYIDAERSLAIYGDVPDEIFDPRMDECRECPHRMDSYDPVGHCGLCRCGKNRRAALTVKGKMPLSKCEDGRWIPYDPTLEGSDHG